MPRGPLGGPRPFASGELVYKSRYRLDPGLGERLEDSVKRNAAERRIAQRVEDVGFRDPSVEVAPAGYTILVIVGLGDGPILPTGSTEMGFGELRDTVDEAVKAEAGSGASKRALEDPEWEIEVK